MRPDEARDAGDERLHAKTSRTRSGSRHGLPDGSTRRVHGLARRGDRLIRLFAPPGTETPSAPATASVLPSSLQSRRRTAPGAGTGSGPRSPAARCRRLPSRGSSTRGSAAGRRGPPRTTRGSSRSRPPPFYRSRRSAPAAWRPTLGISDATAASRRGAQVADGALGIRRPEHGVARDQDVGPRGHDPRRGPDVDPAVDLDRRSAALAAQQVAHGPHLRLRAGDESLPAEARIHRHHQDVVHVAGNLLRAP